MMRIVDAQQAAIAALGRAGDWLDATQRIAAWREVRAAATDRLDLDRRAAVSPNASSAQHSATDELTAAAMEVVHRVATDPGRLTRAWADEQIGELGEEVYTELVGVVAIASVIDRFHDATGATRPDLPDPEPGQPSRVRPADVGDIGAWVSQTTGPARANVSRTLSLVPVTNDTWRDLVDSHYSRGAEFMSAVWDRTLSRPQIELLAARTTVLNECFY